MGSNTLSTLITASYPQPSLLLSKFGSISAILACGTRLASSFMRWETPSAPARCSDSAGVILALAFLTRNVYVSANWRMYFLEDELCGLHVR